MGLLSSVGENQPGQSGALVKGDNWYNRNVQPVAASDTAQGLFKGVGRTLQLLAANRPGQSQKLQMQFNGEDQEAQQNALDRALRQQENASSRDLRMDLEEFGADRADARQSNANTSADARQEKVFQNQNQQDANRLARQDAKAKEKLRRELDKRNLDLQAQLIDVETRRAGKPLFGRVDDDNYDLALDHYAKQRAVLDKAMAEQNAAVGVADRTGKAQLNAERQKLLQARTAAAKAAANKDETQARLWTQEAPGGAQPPQSAQPGGQATPFAKWYDQRSKFPGQ